VVFFPLGVPIKTMYASHVLHALPISSSFILWWWWWWWWYRWKL